MTYAIYILFHKLERFINDYPVRERTYLIATITDREMAQTTARSAEFGSHYVQVCLTRRRLKAMTGVMTMFQADVAGYA